jgi:hypothetical protein
VDPKEIRLVIVLVVGTVVTIALNRRTHNLLMAKLNAYMFMAIIIAVMTKVSLIYMWGVESGTTLYMFILFLVFFTIPWSPWEINPIGLMHGIGYNFLFLAESYAVYKAGGASIDIVPSYIDGLILLFLSALFCFVIRMRDTEREVDNFVLLKDVQEKSQQMKKELELATRIQKTLIPKSISTELMDISVLYLPMEFIGGDYAKFKFFDGKKLVLFICDVTGHGVSAALLVNRLHAEFERLADLKSEPGTLLRELNEFILRDFDGTGMYLTAFCCLLDLEKMSLSYSNYGHPDQYVYRLDGANIQSLKPNASLMGIAMEDKDIHQNTLNFEKGNKVFLFTDGVLETKNKHGEAYGKERLVDFLIRNRSVHVDKMNHALLEELRVFNGGDFQDDVFALNIHIK